MTPGQIGILLAVGPFVSIIVQSPWGYLSDRLQTVKKIIIIQILLTLLMSLFIFNLHSFYLLIPAVFFFYAFFLPTFPLLDCLILAAIKDTKENFGAYRVWGSLGFAVTALSSGWVLAKVGIEKMDYLYQGLLVISLLLALLVKDIPPACKAGSSSRFRELIARREILIILVFIAFINATNRANDAFMGHFIKSIGGSEVDVGWAWTLGPLSEMPVFLLSGMFLSRYKEVVLLALAATTYSVRWLLFAITTNPDLIILIQLLHGLSFGLFYMSAVSYISKRVPPELRASGQGLLATFGGGIAGIAGSFLGGAIMEALGPRSLYYTSSTVALVSVVLFMLAVNIPKTS